MARPSFERVLSHLTAVVAGFVFVLAGAMQVVGTRVPGEAFASWGYPSWVMHAVGAFEVLGALLLVVPATRIAGAILLGVVMLGAVGTHLMNFEYGALVAPIVLGGLAAISGFLALERRGG